MKHYRKELWFEVKNRRELINITPLVIECIQRMKIMQTHI